MTEQSLPEESIFLQALDIEAAADRAAFLEQRCGTDARLREGVEALLRASLKSGDLLDVLERLAATEGATIAQPLLEKPGVHIGPY